LPSQQLLLRAANFNLSTVVHLQLDFVPSFTAPPVAAALYLNVFAALKDSVLASLVHTAPPYAAVRLRSPTSAVL
jgi:hypothetical protein